MTTQKFVEFIMKNEKRKECLTVSGFVHKLKDIKILFLKAQRITAENVSFEVLLFISCMLWGIKQINEGRNVLAHSQP